MQNAHMRVHRVHREKVLKIDRPDGRKVLRVDEADAPRVKAAASRQLVSRFETPRPLGAEGSKD